MIERLHNEGVGVLFAYSVESKGSTHSSTDSDTVCRVSSRHMQAMHDAVRVASTFGSTDEGWSLKPTSVALKFSGLVTDPTIYKRASEALEARGVSSWDHVEGELFPVAEDGRPGLTKEDAKAMEQLKAQLGDLCGMARERGVRIIVDAEYSWFQVRVLS